MPISSPPMNFIDALPPVTQMCQEFARFGLKLAQIRFIQTVLNHERTSTGFITFKIILRLIWEGKHSNVFSPLEIMMKVLLWTISFFSLTLLHT